jgi:hypothetical protein
VDESDGAVAKVVKYFLEHSDEQEKLAESINTTIGLATPLPSSSGSSEANANDAASTSNSGSQLDRNCPPGVPNRSDINSFLHSPKKDAIFGQIADKALDPLGSVLDEVFGESCGTNFNSHEAF